MSCNAKFRWFLLAPIVLALLVVTSPVISWAGIIVIPQAQEQVRQNPNDAAAQYNLGIAYDDLGQYQKAVASYKEAIRIKPDYAATHFILGRSYGESGQYQEAIASYKETIRIKPNEESYHPSLGRIYV